MPAGILWVRMDAARAAHPKVRRAGFWGKVAWEAIIDLAKQFGRGGKLGRSFCTGLYLAEWLDPRGEVVGMAAMMEAGVKRATEAGLLEEHDPKTLAVHDWADIQRDSGVADRVRRWREKQPFAVRNALRTPFVTDNIHTGHTGRDNCTADEAADADGSSLSLADRIDLAYRREWEAVPGHGMARPASTAAAKVAAWASSEGLDLDALLPAIRWVCGKGKGLALLPSVFDEVAAARPAKPEPYVPHYVNGEEPY